VINRRHFLQAAAAAPFIPHGIAVAGAADSTFDSFFYDERFDEARRLAAQAAGRGTLTPVRGDVTELWNAELDRASSRSALTLRGVTTESFHFCLKIMLSSKTRIETTVTRVDRDLFRWVIRTSGVPA